MTQEHPITPPPELVQAFLRSNPVTPDGMTYEEFIATRFARWGADQELEACRLWVSEEESIYAAADLVKARRPKPPSLKAQALCHLESFAGSLETLGMDSDLIRRAIESLPD